MPKIIENVREQLLSEAKRQICENGYAKTTVRSVAAACGLGVGTVYNYFPSKDMLIASFMADEWHLCLDRMRNADKSDVRAVMYVVYSELRSYTEAYRDLFSDKDAAKVFATVFSERHSMLRSQIAEIILPLCDAGDAFLADFIAESMLTWTVSGKEFDELYRIIERLFK